MHGPGPLGLGLLNRHPRLRLKAPGVTVLVTGAVSKRILAADPTPHLFIVYLIHGQFVKLSRRPYAIFANSSVRWFCSPPVWVTDHFLFWIGHS